MAVLTPRGVYPPGLKPRKSEIIQLLEQIMGSASAPAVVKETKAQLDLVTPTSETYGGLVLNDSDPTKNGYYYRSSSTWVKGRGFPDTFAKATFNGAGTAQTMAFEPGVNPADVLVYFGTVSVENTGAFTLDGIDVVNAAGNALSAGEWTGTVLFFINGDGDYQLLFAAGAVAAAAQSATDAEAAQTAAELARDQAQAAASTATTGGFASIAAAEAYSPVTAPDFMRVEGYSSAGDGGGALYKKVGSEPSHAGKFSITLDDGVTVVWYEIAEQVISERMFGAPCDGDWAYGGTDAVTQLQAWADCPVTNRKRFTGVSKSSDNIEFPIDTILEGGGFDTGIDLSGATSLTGSTGILFDNSANLIQIDDLSSNVSKGATTVTLTDAGDIEPGDWFCIYNPTDHSWTAGNVAGSRDTYRAGEWCRAQSKSGNVITLMWPLWAGYTAASVDVYRLRGIGPHLHNFRIKPPYLEVSAIKVDCGISPVIENVRTDGSEYAGILLQRCIDEYVNCNGFQMIDAGTPGNEYALVHSSCFRGEIHGSYDAQRHGIAFGNADFVCCVPNRSARVYADTSSPHGVGSLDFGHGCNENLFAIGGTHSGIALGGKGHKFIGLKVRKGVAVGGGTNSLLISGSEFVGGDFTFIGCDLEALAPSDGSSNAHIVFTLQAAIVEPVRFIFDGCTFDIDATSSRVFEIVTSATSHDASLIVDDPKVIGGAGLTAFARLNHVSGNGYDLAAVRGVKGLGPAISRLTTNGSPPVSSWLLDPQTGTVSVAGNTGASSASAAVSFPWVYPAGVTPFCQAWVANSNVGGDRCIAIAGSVTNTGFSAQALTTDSANFASTTAGTVAWRAEVG